MGVWGDGLFDNDSAQDLADLLNGRGGIAALKLALGRNLVQGVSRSAQMPSSEEIERMVSVALEKQRAHLDAGLKVEALGPFEVRVRRAFSQVDVGFRSELLAYLAAISILAHLSRPTIHPLEASISEAALKRVYKNWIDLRVLALDSFRLLSERHVLVEAEFGSLGSATLQWAAIEEAIATIEATADPSGQMISPSRR
jgi:hypothetical protein